MTEIGYFQRIAGAHLGSPNILLLACGHEDTMDEPVGAGTRLCLACGRGEPGREVSGEYWEEWCESFEGEEG